MIPHHVIFIHGIGDASEGFSLRLQDPILKEFSQTVLRLTKHAPPANGIHFREALWSSVTHKQQDELWNTLFPLTQYADIPMRSRVTLRGSLKDFRKDPKFWVKSWLQSLKYWSWFRKLVVVYQGDLIAYIESPGENKYRLIHDRIYNAILECTKLTIQTEATPQNPALVTVVGHSLGSVIASDMLYDTLEKKSRWWPVQLRLANLFSLGSPLTLYTLRYKASAREFQHPVRMQDSRGLWVNLYDPQDIVGYPLKPLNAAYDSAVFLDKEINLGNWWNFWHLLLRNTPFNHYIYLEDYTVAKIIGRKAALDWIWTNTPEMATELTREYASYQNDLRERYT